MMRERVLPAAMTSVAAADEARLRAIFSDNFSLVWRALRRLGVPDAGLDDAAQQVFLVTSRRLADVQVGSERGFVVSTALRVAADVRKAEKRRREVAHADVPEPPSSRSPKRADDLLDQKRARALLDSVLEELPADLRVVFVLFELEEMSSTAIAELLDIPVGTAASRLRRAREEFQAAVKRLRARGGVERIPQPSGGQR